MSALEVALGRSLTASEKAIDIVKLDRALLKAKNELTRAIQAEMVTKGQKFAHDGILPHFEITSGMLRPLDRLHALGEEEARLELHRLGYSTRHLERVEGSPHGIHDVTGYLLRSLRRIKARLVDDLVTIDIGADQEGSGLGALTQAEIARAIMDTPGARDLASRVVSTALISGFTQTWEDSADIVSGWTISSVLDGNTCDPCSALDGTEYATWAELEEVMPSGGPVPDCDGGGRCRCRAVPLPA